MAVEGLSDLWSSMEILYIDIYRYFTFLKVSVQDCKWTVKLLLNNVEKISSICGHASGHLRVPQPSSICLSEAQQGRYTYLYDVLLEMEVYVSAHLCTSALHLATNTLIVTRKMCF